MSSRIISPIEIELKSIVNLNLPNNVETIDKFSENCLEAERYNFGKSHKHNILVLYRFRMTPLGRNCILRWIAVGLAAHPAACRMQDSRSARPRVKGHEPLCNPGWRNTPMFCVSKLPISS